MKGLHPDTLISRNSIATSKILVQSVDCDCKAILNILYSPTVKYSAKSVIGSSFKHPITDGVMKGLIL